MAQFLVVYILLVIVVGWSAVNGKGSGAIMAEWLETRTFRPNGSRFDSRAYRLSS